MGTDDVLEEQNKLLKEILKWIKIGGIKKVKEVLTNNLTDNNKKLVYHFSDGNKNIWDICKTTGIKSTATISNYWNQWKKIGIVEVVPAKRGERIKKIFELSDFDIEVPKINIKSKENVNGFQENKIQETSENDNFESKTDIQENLIEEGNSNEETQPKDN